MLITSLNNDTVKELVKLKDKKYRDNNNLFFVEGKDLCDIAYENGLLRQIYILDGYDNIYDGIPVTYVSKEVMKKISDMVCISEYFGVCAKKVETDIGNHMLILDDIQDPGNLGTIIRSAVAFNFDTIVLSHGTVDLYNPKVIRSTEGMLFHINIIQNDLVKTIEDLKEKNYRVYGTDVIDGTDINDLSNTDKTKFALVVGNEGNGVSKELYDLFDDILHINMNENVESLNVSVATSIILYEMDSKNE